MFCNWTITSTDGLWKSNDKGTFDKINESPNSIRFNSLVVTSNNVVYIGTFKGNGGIWTINLIEQLITINKPDTIDKSWPLYKGIVYNSGQKIDIKENLVASAKLDGNSITVPSTNVNIPVGEHTLVLTLKDKTFANVFGGDPNTGEITYKLWVKTSIVKKRHINYTTNTDDTDLTDLSLGFVSTSGNTNGCSIIQTKSKDGSVHNAPLITNFADSLIDHSNSYYIYTRNSWWKY
ncbi:hypothetical protein [Spiroplasma endosymbiont of Nebria brevicollis]|uniref:hypothetical protein n=1 Tax=Spiroplasma endosymbiont of Nebria brevicollis TaxID=3066284 RepID=UPI00313DADB1